MARSDKPAIQISLDSCFELAAYYRQGICTGRKLFKGGHKQRISK